MNNQRAAYTVYPNMLNNDPLLFHLGVARRWNPAANAWETNQTPVTAKAYNASFVPLNSTSNVVTQRKIKSRINAEAERPWILVIK